MTQELSILQAIIDADFLTEDETKDIKALDSRYVVDNIIIDALRHNQNLLRDRRLPLDIALSSNLEEIGKGLLELDIQEELPRKIKLCAGNQSCLDTIINEISEEVFLTEKEADNIAIERGINLTNTSSSTGNSTGDDTGSAVAGSSGENTTIASSTESSTQGTNYTPSSSSKKISDAYLIKLLQPAKAICNNGVEYSSLLTVEAKGKITFNEELTDDCIIIVGGGNIVDSNNNGVFDENIDKVIGFELRAPSTATFIVPKKFSNARRVISLTSALSSTYKTFKILLNLVNSFIFTF
jgi:hypothetical protein